MSAIRRIRALAGAEALLLRRNPMALLTGILTPVSITLVVRFGQPPGKPAPSSASIIASLAGFAFLGVVYYNLVTILVARRQELMLKRLRTGEATDAEILVGAATPSVLLAWAQIALAFGIFSLRWPGNVVVLLLGLVLGTLVFGLLAAISTTLTRTVEMAQITTLPVLALSAVFAFPGALSAMPRPVATAGQWLPMSRAVELIQQGMTGSGSAHRCLGLSARAQRLDGRQRMGDAPLVPLGAPSVRAPWQAGRMGLTRAWGTRTDVDRADFATRSQLMAAATAEPLAVVLSASSSPQEHHRAVAMVLVLLLSVVHAGVCVMVMRAALNRLRNGSPVSRRLVVGVAALAAAGIALSVVAFPATVHGQLSAAAGGSMLAFAAATAAAYTLLLPVRVLPALVVVPGTVLVIVQAVVDDLHHSLWVIYYVIVVTTVIATYASSAWFLGVLWELARGQEAQAQLAVAEERLRFSRDLHDVLGRNLALIAVNSELAAELARREDPGAVHQMLAVQQVAQDSVRELREVVSGYRAAALDVELAGAQSLLRATGIDVRLSGDGHQLAMTAQDALGWVVREATTNIIRHSNPSHVTFELTSDDAAAILLIRNDGVHARAAQGGHGLVGLRERLAAIGGSLSTESLPDNRFALSVRVPLASEAVL